MKDILTRGHGEDLNKYLKKKGKSYLVATPLKYYIPTEYQDKGLYIEDIGYINTIGLGGVVVGKEYFTMKMPTMFKTMPSIITQEIIDNKTYNVLNYEIGDTFIDNVTVNKGPAYVYTIESILVARAYIAWYGSADDICDILTNIGEFTGLDFDKLPVIQELIVSLIIRNKEGGLNRYGGKITDDVFFKGIAGINANTPSLFRKLTGSYQKAGLRDALVTEESTPTLLEDILRR